MRIYIAGPMTGYPQFNFPTFDGAAAMLRRHGHDVINPAELDSPETRVAARTSPDGALVNGCVGNDTYGDLIARDVKRIADGVDLVAFLPAWDNSKGARLEAFVGLIAGKSFAYVDSSSPEGLYPITADAVRKAIKARMP